MGVSLPQIYGSAVGIAPSVGIPTPDDLHTVPSTLPQYRRFRRPNRSSETQDRYVVRAVPEGMQRPDHSQEVLEAFVAHPEYDVIRSDRRQALHRCLEALVSVADFASMTTRPSWSKLAQMLGVARRTVARYLQQLRSMGLLGVVASGRSAKYASKGLDGQRTNEAAVYVLCIPKRLSGSKSVFATMFGSKQRGVDESGTPPSEAGLYLSNKEVNPYTRARKMGSRSKEQKRLGVSVEQVRWNRHWVPQNRSQQLTAAWRLKQILANVLGKMSDRDVASCVRWFFDAGWSVDDIHHALDHQPDGSPWPHSGAPETKDPRRLRGWLKYRLNAWLDEAKRPVASLSQQKQQRHERQRYERQVSAEYQLKRKKLLEQTDPDVKSRALEKMRQILRRR